MHHHPFRRLALVGASLALGVTLSACGADEETPTDSGADLVSASEGDLSLTDGFAYATLPMADSSADHSGGESHDHSDGESDDHSDEPMDEESMGSDGSMDDSMGDDSMGDMGLVTGAFGTLSNDGDSDDALVAAACDDAGMVQIHETIDNGDGGGTMQPVDKIVVPAGGSVKLEPGGYHVMLMGLKHELKAGDTITITLTFESGTEITADFPVIERVDRP